MQRSKEIDLTGTYQNLTTLVNTALDADGEARWEKSGHTLTFYNPRTNTASRIQITSDGIDKKAEKEILVEQSDGYNSGGAVHNSVVLIDKLIRIVDLADAAMTGTCIVSFEWA